MAAPWFSMFVIATVGQTTTGTELCVFNHDKNGTVAHCSNRQLHNVPNTFPENTTWIDLSHNKVSVLNISQELLDLVYLDISYNRLCKLEENTFHSVLNLEELRLNHNRLTLSGNSYPDSVFTPLQQLRILHLHNNDDDEILRNSSTIASNYSAHIQNNDPGWYPNKALGQLKNIEELSIDTFVKTTFGPGFGQMKHLTHFLLGFKGCRLTWIQNDTFRVFSEINIEVLNLDHCPTAKIEINAFWYLRHLKYLYMSHCNLSPREAVKSLYGLRGRNMSLIQMDNVLEHSLLTENHYENYILSDDLLDFIKNVCVANLYARHNQILWVGSNMFNSLGAECLEHVDVSDNDIYGDSRAFFIFSEARNLKYVDISRFSVKTSNWPFQTKTTSTPLEAYQGAGITLPSGLQYLNINGYNVNYNRMIDIEFYNGSSLKEFYMAMNRITRFQRIVGLDNLSVLDVSGNNCGSLLPEFFRDFPSLSVLNMSGCGLNQPEDYLIVTGPQLLRPLRKLKILSLSHNDLTLISENLFAANPLQKIDLSFNRFEHIPFDPETTRHLQYLDLSFNSLTTLDQSDTDRLDRLEFSNGMILDLTGNLLFCGCENLNFIFWLYNTNVHVKNADSYSCIREDGSISNMSESYKQSESLWRRCTGVYWLSVSITCFAVIILVMSFIYVICRRKTFIRNILFRLFGIYTHITHPSRKDFVYAAFLGYSDLDYKYICHTVPDKLEKKHKIRVFITDRDMLPGTSTSEEIVHAVDSSWRIVLVLTQAFLQDNWCRFITEQAVYVSTFRPPGSVVLVLFDDVRLGDIPPDLLNVVEEKHIFRVSRYWEDHDVLWKDIGEAIKTE